MPTYAWKNKFNIGIAASDSEHKHLLGCINKLINAQEQGLNKAITLKLADEVILYAKFHFLSEENLMCLTHYPAMMDHSELHRTLINELEYKRRNLDDSIKNLSEFISCLVHWFIDHTQTIDREYAEYLKKYSPESGSSEAIIKSIAMEKKSELI